MSYDALNTRHPGERRDPQRQRRTAVAGQQWIPAFAGMTMCGGMTAHGGEGAT